MIADADAAAVAVVALVSWYREGAPSSVRGDDEDTRRGGGGGGRGGNVVVG